MTTIRSTMLGSWDRGGLRPRGSAQQAGKTKHTYYPQCRLVARWPIPATITDASALVTEKGRSRLGSSPSTAVPHLVDS